MKILIINQHTSNRGDESAGKALIRALLKSNENISITVVYFNHFKNSEAKFFTESNRVTNIDNNIFLYGVNKLKSKIIYNLYLLFKLPNIFRKLFAIIFVGKFLRPYYSELKLISRFDYVISAPSGPNLSRVYMDETYLWKIFSAMKMKKKYAIYSPSVGKLENKTSFEKKAILCLSQSKFISVRDYISYNHLDSIGIRYIKSVDTAFLDKSVNSYFPAELNFLFDKPYIVFVPNQLYKWHNLFKSPNIENNVTLDNFYCSIIQRFTKKNVRIVMLPQLFAGDDDSKYFSSLVNRIADKSLDIILVDKMYDSDIQQHIIKKSEFVIGARYHSIVFAINNVTPFFSISYEYKMSGLLKLLSLSDNEIILTPDFEFDITESINRIIAAYDSRKDIIPNIRKASSTASKIADKTFNEFQNTLN